MSNIIVTPSSKQEFQFLLSLLKKLKVANRVIEDEELEDIGLGLAMKEADRHDLVSETEITNLLNSKL